MKKKTAEFVDHGYTRVGLIPNSRNIRMGPFKTVRCPYCKRVVTFIDSETTNKEGKCAICGKAFYMD